MNILHLKYAVEVAKTQSISKAAENLYMGQPNLSRAIKELEESLGITIFKRTSKGISTTNDGDEFLRLARRIVAQVEEVEDIYRSKHSRKQVFSVCGPRAGYISAAMTKFTSRLSPAESADILYRETNSGEAVSGVVRGDFNLGIVRFRTMYEKFFVDLFKEKKLIYETAVELPLLMLISKSDPLADKTDVSPDDIAGYIEISYGDTYVPTIPQSEVKKAEQTENVERRVFVYDRASQLELLSRVPNSFSQTDPVPQEALDRYGLTVREFPRGNGICRDVLIYRKDYKLTDSDKSFIADLYDSKRDCFK